MQHTSGISLQIFYTKSQAKKNIWCQTPVNALAVLKQMFFKLKIDFFPSEMIQQSAESCNNPKLYTFCICREYC